MKQKVRKPNKWPLAVAIVLLISVIIFGLIITDLMRTGIIPKDWYIFHDYLSRTGSVKIYGYVGAIIYLIIVPIIIPLKLKIVTEKSAYLIGFWFLLSNAIDSAGNFTGWYAVNAPYSVYWYDNFAHIMGGFIYTSIAWIIWNNMINKRDRDIPLRFKIILSILTAIMLGTMYGIYEYYSDIIRHTYMTGSVEDVITDNVYDIIGSLVAGGLLFGHYFKDGVLKLLKKSPYRYLTNINWE